jgi:hypothetical protein
VCWPAGSSTGPTRRSVISVPSIGAFARRHTSWAATCCWAVAWDRRPHPAIRCARPGRSPRPTRTLCQSGPWNTDGLVAVIPLHSSARSHYLQEVMAAGHPVVFVGSGEAGPAIKADNAGGIEVAMRHLVEHGPPPDRLHRRQPGRCGGRLRSAPARLPDGAAHLCLASDPQLIAYGPACLCRRLHRHAADHPVRRPPSRRCWRAIDESALGAMQALKDVGRKIPEEVAVIGFDDRPESAAHEPGVEQYSLSAVLDGLSGGRTAAQAD